MSLKSYEELIGRSARRKGMVVYMPPELLALLDAECRRLAASQHKGRRRVPRTEGVRAILEAYLLPRAKELARL